MYSAINSLDALTTFHLNKRASGSHTGVLSLVKGILAGPEFKDIEKQFGSLLGLKNASEYQPDFMSKNQAENPIKWTEGILDKKNKSKTLMVQYLHLQCNATVLKISFGLLPEHTDFPEPKTSMVADVSLL